MVSQEETRFLGGGSGEGDGEVYVALGVAGIPWEGYVVALVGQEGVCVLVDGLAFVGPDGGDAVFGFGGVCGGEGDGCVFQVGGCGFVFSGEGAVVWYCVGCSFWGGVQVAGPVADLHLEVGAYVWSAWLLDGVDGF